MVNKLLYIIISGFIIGWSLMTTQLHAKQVVTESDRLWAKQVLEQEKQLSTISDSNTLAVLYFNNKTNNSKLNPLQKGLTLMLMTDLSKLKNIRLIERVKLQALIEEMNFGKSGLVETSTAPRVGRLLGARYTVGGDILDGKTSNLLLSSTLLEVPKAKLFPQPDIEGKLSELFQMEKKILFSIVEQLKIVLTPEQVEDLKKPISSNIKALMSLFRAVDYADQGNFKKAGALYRKAMKQDPKLAPAKEGYLELKNMGHITNKGKSQRLLKTLKNRTSLTDQLKTEEASKYKTNDIMPTCDVLIEWDTGLDQR